jgi:hypothetical protein
MIGFRVIASVRHYPRQTRAPQSVGNEWPKLVDVGSRPTTRVAGQNEMIVGVADHAKLGIAMINDRFPGLRGTYAPSNEVAAGTGAFQAGGVDCRCADPPSMTCAEPRRGVEQTLGVGRGQQPLRGFLQRGEVGDLMQC